jgi:transposase
VVWAAPGRNAATLQAFFDELTAEQKASIQAVSIDMSAGYEKAIREAVPDAAIAFDPFHVVQVRHEALPVRAGCKTLPPGCRGSPVKLRTV